MKKLTFAFDYDGTLTVDGGSYPKVGHIDPIIKDIAIELKRRGHRIILWTCREGLYLKQAVDYCHIKGIDFDGVNDNSQQSWESRKIYYFRLFDDRSLGWGYVYDLACKLPVEEFCDRLERGEI